MTEISRVSSDFMLWARDTGERAAKTFVQFFILQLIVSGWFQVQEVTNMSMVQRAAISAGGAALSVLSSALSKVVGSPDSASLVGTVVPAVEVIAIVPAAEAVDVIKTPDAGPDVAVVVKDPDCV